MSEPRTEDLVPFSEQSGKFRVLIDMERPEESVGLLDDIAAVGAQVDKQLSDSNAP